MTSAVRQRFPTKAAALGALAEAMVEISRGTHLAPVEAKTTVRQYVAWWELGLQVAPSTRDLYETCVRRHILTALGHRPLNTLQTIYRTLFVQSRGALRKELTRYLRTGRVIRRAKNVRLPDGRGGRPNTLHIS